MKVLYNALRPGYDPFQIFQKVETAYTPQDLTANGVLLLHGGEDISPSIYGQEPIDQCYASREPAPRDVKEMALVEQAVKMGIPIIGLCRGAQLICAMDGGSLYQHCVGHAGGDHSLFDVETEEGYVTNSAHHQVMRPREHNKIIAISQKDVMVWETSDTAIKVSAIPEIVFFPYFKALAIQGHPEWNPNPRFVQYCTSLIKNYLLKD